MTGKYTIKIDPALHKWFKREAVEKECTISALVVEAMETYRQEHSGSRDKQPSDRTSLESKSLDDPLDPKPREYLRAHYKPGTHELNDSPRAKKVGAAANKAKGFALKAGASGIKPKHLHDLLAKAGFDFGLRRDALSYLDHHAILRREREGWVHAQHVATSGRRPRK